MYLGPSCRFQRSRPEPWFPRKMTSSSSSAGFVVQSAGRWSRTTAERPAEAASNARTSSIFGFNGEARRDSRVITSTAIPMRQIQFGVRYSF